MNIAAKLKTALLTLALAAGILAAVPPQDAFAACLSAGEARAAIASGQALPPGQITATLQRRYRVDIIDVQLCAEGRRYVYQVTVLGPAGRVRRVVVNASNGQLLGGGL
jgi:uncharacterized membrane protein YkoI